MNESDLYKVLAHNPAMYQEYTTILMAHAAYTHQQSGVHGFIYSRNETVLQLFANLTRAKRTLNERTRPVGQPYVQQKSVQWLVIDEVQTVNLIAKYRPSIQLNTQLFSRRQFKTIETIDKTVHSSNFSSHDEEVILCAFDFQQL